MRVYVDCDRCRGHAQCEVVCPEVFHVDEEDGLAHVLIEHPGEEFRQKVQEAYNRCPEDAIFIFEGNYSGPSHLGQERLALEEVS